MDVSLNDVKYIASETKPERLGISKAEIAFVGRSNVGKSSLLNALCRKDLARVSGAPGRTRSINVFLVGKDRWLVDLPGYGYAGGRAEEIANWGPMIETYLVGRQNLRMVFLLIDAKVGPTKLDFQMIRWLDSKRLPRIVVATKSDQVKAARSSARRIEIAQAMGMDPDELAWVSADKGVGIRELRASASAILNEDEATGPL